MTHAEVANLQALFAEYAATLSDKDEDKCEEWGTPRSYWEGEAHGFLEWLKAKPITLTCFCCGKPSQDESITIGWETSDDFTIQRPTCRHNFVVCPDCVSPDKCPACGCPEFYT